MAEFCHRGLASKTMNTPQVLMTTPLCGRAFDVYGSPEEPMFKAQDIAKLLQLTNVSDMIQRVDEEELTKLNLGSQSGETWFLTEDGLYEVLMQSRKPIAKQFKKGVKMVLKEIRQNGGYVASTEADTPEVIMARALQVAQATIERHKHRLQMAETTIQAQSEQLTAQAPKVAFATAILGSQTSCLIGELAKIITQNGYPIGQKRLFHYLRENGYLCKRGEAYNQPVQKYIEQGLFELKRGIRSGNEGVMHTTITTKVTPKGQAYFIGKLLNPLTSNI